LIALLSCDPREAEADPAAPLDGEEADGEEVEADAGYEEIRTRQCSQWGSIGLPWAPGTYALDSYGSTFTGPYLLGRADAMELRDPYGDSVDCSVTDLYVCKAPHGGGTITATFRGERWSWPARCPENELDAVQLNLNGAACVEAGTVVLEGELMGVDPARATPLVVLEGPWQHFVRSEDPTLPHEEAWSGHLPARECRVDGGHYTCPTLGFATTEQHVLVVGGLRSELTLEVKDCSATTTRLNVTCPALPAGFYVELPEDASKPQYYDVEASYEGGEPQPCVLQSHTVSRDASDPHPVSHSRIFCPPAAGHEWGRGHYEITATPRTSTGNPSSYASHVTDVFDACGGTAGPVILRRVGSPE
jgi:hypothetical protein